MAARRLRLAVRPRQRQQQNEEIPSVAVSRSPRVPDPKLDSWEPCWTLSLMWPPGILPVLLLFLVLLLKVLLLLRRHHLLPPRRDGDGLRFARDAVLPAATRPQKQGLFPKAMGQPLPLHALSLHKSYIISLLHNMLQSFVPCTLFVPKKTKEKEKATTKQQATRSSVCFDEHSSLRTVNLLSICLKNGGYCPGSFWPRHVFVLPESFGHLQLFFFLFCIEWFQDETVKARVPT